MRQRFITAFLIFIAITIVFTGCKGCKKEKHYNVKTYTTQEELIREAVSLFNEGNIDKINDIMIQKEFFINEIYPNTAEGRSPGHMKGEDFWNSITNLKRPYNIRKNAEKYRGAIISLENIGEPNHVVEFGPYQYLRHVKITLKIKNKKTGLTETVENDDLIGIVVKDKDMGKYMFMNTFR